MPDNEFPPLIYVDLVEEEPLANSGRITSEQYQAYLDRFQPFRVVIRSGDNHRVLFRSTERYFNKADALHAAQLAFGSGSNVYLRQPEQGNILLRRALEA